MMRCTIFHGTCFHFSGNFPCPVNVYVPMKFVLRFRDLSNTQDGVFCGNVFQQLTTSAKHSMLDI